MQRSLLARLRFSPISSILSSSHVTNSPLIVCKGNIRTSAAVSMPRRVSGGGRKSGRFFSCPICQTTFMYYCKFSGTERTIRCHSCDKLITVKHNSDPDHPSSESENEMPDDIYYSLYSPLDDKSKEPTNLTDSRLGRIFDPPYEEPKSEDTETIELGTAPRPKKIFQYLDRFVQGQDRAKLVLAVTIYNHYKRLHAEHNETSEDVPRLDKSNILLIGPTGSGKTYMFQMVAKLLDVPMVVCDCTSLTQAGYVGEDVESIIVRLWQASGQSIERTQQGIVVIDELDKLASKRNKHGGKDVGGEGVQQSLLKIIEGTDVTITVPDKGRPRTYQIDTRNILFLASGAFVGLDEIIKRRTATKSLGFGTSMMPEHYIKSGVLEDQPNRELGSVTLSKSRLEKLKQIKDTEEKNRVRDQLLVQVEPRDILDYGVIPELAGRIPVLVTLDSLTQDDLVKIASCKERGVISQLQELFSLNDCELEFTDDALQSVAELAFCKKTGARALKSITEKTLLDAMFEIPGSDISHVQVTSETVLDNATPIYTYKEPELEVVATDQP